MCLRGRVRMIHEPGMPAMPFSFRLHKQNNVLRIYSIAAVYYAGKLAPSSGRLCAAVELFVCSIPDPGRCRNGRIPPIQ